MLRTYYTSTYTRDTHIHGRCWIFGYGRFPLFRFRERTEEASSFPFEQSPCLVCVLSSSCNATFSQKRGGKRKTRGNTRENSARKIKVKFVPQENAGAKEKSQGSVKRRLTLIKGSLQKETFRISQLTDFRWTNIVELQVASTFSERYDRRGDRGEKRSSLSPQNYRTHTSRRSTNIFLRSYIFA